MGQEMTEEEFNICAFCTAKCCKDFVVLPSAEDIQRIVEKTGKKPAEFLQLYPADAVKAASSAPTSLVNMSAYYIGIKHNKNSMDCIFLRGNACAIHNIKPLVCTTYPVVLDENGKAIVKRDARCPKQWKLTGSKKLEEKLKQYGTEMETMGKRMTSWNYKYGKNGDTNEMIDYIIGNGIDAVRTLKPEK